MASSWAFLSSLALALVVASCVLDRPTATGPLLWALALAYALAALAWGLALAESAHGARGAVLGLAVISALVLGGEAALVLQRGWGIPALVVGIVLLGIALAATVACAREWARRKGPTHASAVAVPAATGLLLVALRHLS